MVRWKHLQQIKGKSSDRNTPISLLNFNFSTILSKIFFFLSLSHCC
jgi:hypothetical protein